MLGFYQPISSWTHLLGALLAICTGAILIRKGWGNRIRVLALIVFMTGIVLMFSMSSIYHALEPGLGRQVFRKLDYAAIFVMSQSNANDNAPRSSIIRKFLCLIFSNILKMSELKCR